MKSQLFAPAVAGLTLALGTLPVLTPPSQAQTATYFCGEGKNGVPTTFARNATGRKIEVIRWAKEWGGGISREDRCKIVSERFQSASAKGILSYLTHGVMGGQKVVCAASEYGAPCSDLLFTLRPEDDPAAVINALFGVGYRAKGPLSQGNGESQIYIDMNLLLQERK
ncbi:COP23 domain-containing protein [Kamptonema formosum]|uniref:COP23 domain-containing protein n=1 Tax=Kamptonema formosum TaxID=331992 RepID=UPI000346DA18|nr:COP23 domain-containing protein [Oscillatoria sp. PCC 10802]